MKLSRDAIAGLALSNPARFWFRPSANFPVKGPHDSLKTLAEFMGAGPFVVRGEETKGDLICWTLSEGVCPMTEGRSL